jgi:hypothetical protein
MERGCQHGAALHPKGGEMKVRLLEGRATPETAWFRGDILELPDKEAKALIEAGGAEPVTEKAVDKRETREKVA